jgi:glycerol-3-phosphate dehydrogenase
VPNLIHAAGIQSPGLASSPAIAERVENIFLSMVPSTRKKENYNPIRKERKPFRHCTMEEREALIQENPLYGRIICRCETVTEGEIVAAIHGPVPATNVDAIKRRTRAGMGRCQGGFCQAKVLEILARELGKDETEITLKGKGSQILKDRTRQVEK